MASPVGINSRLRFTDLLEYDGFIFWGMLEYPDIPIQPDDILYTVIEGDRLDLLAYREYGDPILKHVIAAVNDIDIEPTDLNAGTDIRIPSPRWVLNEMNKRKAKF
jgi:phage tail protein X